MALRDVGRVQFCAYVQRKAKLGQNGLKIGKIRLFLHPILSRINFGKMCFPRVFDPFLGDKRPLFKAFWDIPWPKTHHHGLKMD